MRIPTETRMVARTATTTEDPTAGRMAMPMVDRIRAQTADRTATRMDRQPLEVTDRIAEATPTQAPAQRMMAPTTVRTATQPTHRDPRTEAPLPTHLRATTEQPTPTRGRTAPTEGAMTVRTGMTANRAMTRTARAMSR